MGQSLVSRETGERPAMVNRSNRSHNKRDGLTGRALVYRQVRKHNRFHSRKFVSVQLPSMGGYLGIIMELSAWCKKVSVIQKKCRGKSVERTDNDGDFWNWLVVDENSMNWWTPAWGWSILGERWKARCCYGRVLIDRVVWEILRKAKVVGYRHIRGQVSDGYSDVLKTAVLVCGFDL